MTTADQQIEMLKQLLHEARAEIERLAKERDDVQGMASLAHAEVSRLQAENARLRAVVEAAQQDKWEADLMTAQRDEAFKHLTSDQQEECIREACRKMQPQTLELLAALAALEETQ